VTDTDPTPLFYEIYAIVARCVCPSVRHVRVLYSEG